MSNQPIKYGPNVWAAVFVALSLSCLGVPILCCLGVRMHEGIVDERIDRLFANDGRVSVRRFIVLGHQQDGHWPLVVDDTESARYLTDAFQRSSYLGYVPIRNSGSSYEFRVESDQGWSIDFGGNVGSDAYSPVRSARIVALLSSPQGNGSLLVLSTIYQPAEIGLVLGCKEGLMGDPVYYWVPLREPMPATLGKAIYSLGQPSR